MLTNRLCVPILQASKPFYKRHRKWTCCAGCFILTLLALVIAIIVVVTAFKVRDPTIRVNNATLQNLTFTVQFPSFTPDVNLTIRLNVSVHNPNQASFVYTNSSSLLYYHGLDVGEAPIPAGSIGADGDENIGLTLTILAGEFLRSSQLVTDFTNNQIPLHSVTTVSGRVKAFSVYKHHASSTATCDLIVFIANSTLSNFNCQYQVKL